MMKKKKMMMMMMTTTTTIMETSSKKTENDSGPEHRINDLRKSRNLNTFDYTFFYNHINLSDNMMDWQLIAVNFVVA